MKEYHISIGTFLHHDNGVLEIIIDAGVDVTPEMTTEFFTAVRAIEPRVRACLVNRKNTYSYTFKANMMLASAKVVDFVAVVKYKKRPWPLSGLFSPKFYSMGFFDEYDEAMQWLLDKLKNHPEGVSK